MSSDLHHLLEDAAAAPSRSVTVASLRSRMRRRRLRWAAVGSTGLVAAVVALPAPGGGGLRIIEPTPDVAEQPPPVESSRIIELSEPSDNLVADLHQQAEAQALAIARTDEVVLTWNEITLDLDQVDPFWHQPLEQYVDSLGDRPVAPVDRLAATIAEEIRANWQPSHPDFDLSPLAGPPDADGGDLGGREHAWYMHEQADGGGYNEELLAEQVGPILDDLCEWLAQEHAAASAAYRDQLGGQLLAQAPQQLHVRGFVAELVAGELDEPLGDGLNAWIVDACADHLPASERHEPPEPRKDPPPPPPAAPEEILDDGHQLALEIARATAPQPIAEPATIDGNTLRFGTDEPTRPEDSEGQATVRAIVQDHPDLGLLAHQTGYRLEGEPDGWPNGTIVIVTERDDGAGHGYTQVIIHIDDALVSLTGESPNTWEHIYSWAEELAAKLADS